MKEVEWPAPYGYTVFCDDIRQEVGGKRTLIGTYQGVMYVVGGFPANLAKFAMYVYYTEQLEAKIPDQTLKIFFPGDAEDDPSFAIEIPSPGSKRPKPIGDMGSDPRYLINLPIVLPNVQIKEAGRIKVRMFRGDKIYKLGALTVEPAPEIPEITDQDTPS